MCVYGTVYVYIYADIATRMSYTQLATPPQLVRPSTQKWYSVYVFPHTYVTAQSLLNYVEQWQQQYLPPSSLPPPVLY